MRAIQKKIVTDENMRPVAVQIDYADWLEIEQELGLKIEDAPLVDLTPFYGTVKWPEDPLEYQRRVRGT